MKIKMKTTSASPEGSLLADKIYDLTDAEAQVLIDGGYATEVEEVEKVQVVDTKTTDESDDGDEAESKSKTKSRRK